jgi:hypothetical protein
LWWYRSCRITTIDLQTTDCNSYRASVLLSSSTCRPLCNALILAVIDRHLYRVQMAHIFVLSDYAACFDLNSRGHWVCNVLQCVDVRVTLIPPFRQAASISDYKRFSQWCSPRYCTYLVSTDAFALLDVTRSWFVAVHRNFGTAHGFSRVTIHPWRWDRKAVPTRRLTTTNERCVIFQKKEGFIHTALVAWNFCLDCLTLNMDPPIHLKRGCLYASRRDVTRQKTMASSLSLSLSSALPSFYFLRLTTQF